MAITRTKQTWEPRQMVKVGFMNLEVISLIPTPGDYMPDKYWMVNPTNGKKYTFTPHNGIEKGWSN
jgi:hypothetical protein